MVVNGECVWMMVVMLGIVACIVRWSVVLVDGGGLLDSIVLLGLSIIMDLGVSLLGGMLDGVMSS